MKTIKEQALEYASKAHLGQKRKNGGDFIEHPILVAKILEDAGASDELVAAAYLHDTVEDTDVTLNDIYKEFGNIVGDYVKSNTEDKSKSWIERKLATINKIPFEPMEHRLLLVADKIANVLSIKKELDTNGEEKTWNLFNKGFLEQRWYYTTIATSLFINLDKDAVKPTIFNDYLNLTNSVFLSNNNEIYNKVSDIPAKVEHIFKKIEKWWDIEGFEYIREKTITGNGKVRFELGFVLDSLTSEYSKTPASDKETLQTKVQYLTQKGFQFAPKIQGNGLEILDSDNNRELLVYMIKQAFPTAWILSFSNHLIQSDVEKDHFVIRGVSVMVKNLNEIEKLVIEEKYFLLNEDDK